MKKLLIKLGAWIRKNSSLLLTIGAVGGTVGTAVISAKCQKKADEDILEEHSTLTHHIPTIVSTAATSACIIGLYATDQKKQASLVSACLMVQNRYDEFRRAVDARGLDKTEDIDKMIAEEHCPEPVIKTEVSVDEFDKDIFRTEIHSGEPRLCYDTISRRYFIGSLEDIMDERYQINRYFRMTGIMSANDYLKFLGLPEEEWGYGVGWDECVGEDTYGYRWIDIYTEEEELSDGLTVLKVVVPFEPTADYMEY